MQEGSKRSSLSKKPNKWSKRKVFSRRQKSKRSTDNFVIR